MTLNRVFVVSVSTDPQTYRKAEIKRWSSPPPHLGIVVGHTKARDSAILSGSSLSFRSRYDITACTAMSNRLPSLTKIAPKMKGMPGWARRLDRFALSKGVARIPKDIPIDDAEVAKLESSKSKASEAKAGSKVVIPRFYVERKRAKKNRNSEKDFGGESSSSGSSGGHDNTNLQEKIMAVARVDYAKRALKVQATEKDLEMFHGAIKAFSMQRGSPPGWLDYDDYCELKLRAPSRLVPALTTSLFLRLPKDNNGLVKVWWWWWCGERRKFD
eukprot:jgi/Bigna1/71251/fgenesh1_pg.15_\